MACPSRNSSTPRDTAIKCGDRDQDANFFVRTSTSPQRLDQLRFDHAARLKALHDVSHRTMQNSFQAVKTQLHDQSSNHDATLTALRKDLQKTETQLEKERTELGKTKRAKRTSITGRDGGIHKNHHLTKYPPMTAAPVVSA